MSKLLIILKQTDLGKDAGIKDEQIWNEIWIHIQNQIRIHIIKIKNQETDSNQNESDPQHLCVYIITDWFLKNWNMYKKLRYRPVWGVPMLPCIGLLFKKNNLRHRLNRVKRKILRNERYWGADIRRSPCNVGAPPPPKQIFMWPKCCCWKV